MTPSPDYDVLEGLAKNASEGPWSLVTGQTPYPESDDADSWSAILTPGKREIVTLYERYGAKGDDRSDYDDDAAFIAAANPTTILALIANARAGEAAVEALEAAKEKLRAAEGRAEDYRTVAINQGWNWSMSDAYGREAYTIHRGEHVDACALNAAEARAWTVITKDQPQ